ncbi:MAG: helix-turn-helix domain-containing protein [Candidatus Paceibacterota bacterium]
MTFLDNTTIQDIKGEEGLKLRVSSQIFATRLFSGLSQAELAKKMGTKQPSIARAESGNTLPSLSFLQKMAEAIGTRLVEPKFENVIEREAQSKLSEAANRYEVIINQKKGRGKMISPYHSPLSEMTDNTSLESKLN